MADDTPVEIKEADQLLQLDDTEFAKTFGLVGPQQELEKAQAEVEVDGEPSAEAVLEAKPEGEAAPAAEAEAKLTTEPQAETKAEEQAEPEKKEEAPKPVTEFQLFDDQGELDAPPTLAVTFKANGQIKEKVPLDRVVRMAQRAAGWEEKENQLLQIQSQAVQEKQQREALQQEVERYEAWYGRLLADEEFYQRARDDYAQQQSPEARAERAERQLAEERSRIQAQAEAQATASFVQSNLVPRVTQLLEENPTVSFEEVMGRFNLMVAPLLVRGQLPRHELLSVERLIDSQLAEYVRSKHGMNELDKKRVTNQVAAAQTQTTLVKRQLARAQQPRPTSGGQSSAAKPKAFASAEEWLDAALPVDREMD